MIPTGKLTELIQCGEVAFDAPEPTLLFLGFVVDQRSENRSQDMSVLNHFPLLTDLAFSVTRCTSNYRPEDLKDGPFVSWSALGFGVSRVGHQHYTNSSRTLWPPRVPTLNVSASRMQYFVLPDAVRCDAAVGIRQWMHHRKRRKSLIALWLCPPSERRIV